MFQSLVEVTILEVKILPVVLCCCPLFSQVTCTYNLLRAVICLSFWAEVHYNSIYPEGGKVMIGLV